MKSQRVEFANAQGETLAGILDLPETGADHFALFAHCFTCGKNLKTASNISRALTAAGIAVLRFDFTGLGESEGDFSYSNFSSNVSDLIAAAGFLKDSYEAPVLLIGHSLGGTAVLEAAAEITSAKAIATLGSPADPEHVSHLFTNSRDELERNGVAEVDLGGRPFKMRKQFLDDLQQHDLPAEIGGLRKALMVMHSPIDRTVEIDQASLLFQAAKHPKSFTSLDNADHLLTRTEDSQYAGQVLAAWASRFLPPKASESQLQAAEGEVMAYTRGDGYFTEVAAGAHRLVADEPKSVGGTNLGPTPYGLLSAALATCTTMTLRMYANLKKLPLDGVAVKVRHNKVHAEDCGDCETTDGKVDEFVRELIIEGDLDAAQRQRMLEIADRCPVHRTLHGEVKVRTELRDA